MVRTKQVSTEARRKRWLKATGLLPPEDREPPGCPDVEERRPVGIGESKEERAYWDWKILNSTVRRATHDRHTR